jgi:hypothetical protein
VSERGTFDWDARVNEWRLELKAAASARDAALAQVATLTAERDSVEGVALKYRMPGVDHPAIDAARAALQPGDGGKGGA